MCSKFLDPKNDVAFKKIFGSDKNKDILIHFLNDMDASSERGCIKDVTFLRIIPDPVAPVHKAVVVNVLCKYETGEARIVEMQVPKEKGIEKRASYFLYKLYSSQETAGGLYLDLKPVLFLAISDFVAFPKISECKSDFAMLDSKTFENDLKDFYYTFIELPKFNKDIKNLSSIMDKWFYFFKHAAETSEKDLEKIVGQDSIIKRAYEELNRSSWSEEELFAYEQAKKHECDYHAC